MAHTTSFKLVKDIHYEVRVQAVITYPTNFHKVNVPNKEARIMRLTQEQYMQVHIEPQY